MIVHCSIPTIYYGARTHKQLQQVIKEFGRTSYSAGTTMSLLSSRDKTCIREFDKQMWGTRNDMCRGYPNTPRKKEETNCKYYDNRKALDKSRLPAAFDLEDLVSAGRELTACPYYAAREMAQTADIVFCPYNYLIDPLIRANVRSMRITLNNHIVIIDEAHNIEDICRDSATFTFTRDSIQSALK
ncbi:FancJ-like protein, partial [Operophtera brumata]